MQFSLTRSSIEPSVGLAKLAAMVLLVHLAIIAAFWLYSPQTPLRPNPEKIITLTLKPVVGQIESRPATKALQPQLKLSTPPPQAKNAQPAEALVKPKQANPDTSLAPSAPSVPFVPSAPVEPTVGPVGTLPTGKENAKEHGQAVSAQSNTEPDFKAAYLNNPEPPYPRIAIRQQIEGTVTLIVRVMPDGRAGEVRIGQSSGSKALDEAALKTVKDWRFVPARQGGVAVIADVQVPITFKLR